MKQIFAVNELADEYDVAVVGAGPAGLAAAAIAASHTLRVLLVDEGTGLGGQIYRGLGDAPASRRRMLGPDYEQGAALLQTFVASRTSYIAGAILWRISRELEVGISLAGKARMVRCSRVILASGAMERPFPIPGWTLPGVMTVGAVQTLLKGSGLIPSGKFVLVGTGPLLWQVASQLLSGGAAPVALLDTGSATQRLSAVAHLPDFLRSGYCLKGLRLLRQVHRSIPVIFGVTDLIAEGHDVFSQISFRRGNGPRESIGADCLLLHQGVVPNIQLTSAVGCDLVWDSTQACWKPRVDEWGRSSVEAIAIAGDAAGILGSESAAQQGALCGLDAALKLGKIDQRQRDAAANPIRQKLRRFARGRRFLDIAFLPTRKWRLPSADAVVCRCEEVTARQILNVLSSFPVTGPNQMKAYLRCGMGPCQGRLCGLTVTELIAARRGIPPAEVGYYRIRFPVKPITVAEIASLPYESADVRAVVRGTN